MTKMRMEVTSLSSKGQVVIPNDIRERLHLTEGSRLAVITDGENILLKPIEPPRLAEFRALIGESRKIAKEAGVRSKEVKQAIRKTRNADRS